MALVSAEDVTTQAQGFGALPALRQLGLMFGLAVSVALGVTVAMWSQSPNYSMLYGNLSAKDLSMVTQSLDKAGIKYQLEQGAGAARDRSGLFLQPSVKQAHWLDSVPRR